MGHNNMEILYLSSSSQLGGAERSLIDNIFAIRQQLPTANISIIIASTNGALVRELEPSCVGVVLLPLPPKIAKLGDSSFDRRQLIFNLLQLFLASGDLFKYRQSLRQIIIDINPDLIDSNGFKTHLLVLSLIHI
jgi:hypothetical protein